jgi:putative ABC transport system permease protein
MGTLLQDLRYGLRRMLRAPGFTLAAALTLALGIGANTAIFSLAAPILIEPLPFPHAGRIVEVAHVDHGETENGLTGDEALYLLRHQTAFSSAAVVDLFNQPNLSGAGAARQVSGDRVTHGFFEVWGVAPALGRDFTAADDAPGAPPTAILSYGLWHSQFGANPGVLGRTLALNDQPFTVIGVMPAGFLSLEQNPFHPTPVDLWTDLQPTAAGLAPLGPNLDVIARLRPGVTLAQAQAALDLTKAAFNRLHPTVARRMRWGVSSYQKMLAEQSRQPLLLLLGAVGLVLLLACANLANLLLARAAGRRREMAIRTAIGAGRGRLARQLLTESLLLAALGAALGWLLAWWSLPLLAGFAPNDLGTPLAPRLDLTALGFTLALAVVSGVIFGLAPALQAGRLRLQADLKESAGGGGGRGARRARSALIVGEVAVAFVLLAGAALLALSLLALHQVNPGFAMRGVLTAQTSLSGPRVANDAATTRYTEAVVQGLERLPGVAAAASITGVPLQRAMNYPLLIPGHAMDRFSGDVEWRAISPGFFRAMNIPLIQGRAFTAADTAASAKVAIISRVFADHYWPGGHALGRQIGLPDAKNGKAPPTLFRIVGVAADVHENGVDQAPPFTFYVPQAQASDTINALVNHWFPMGFVLRSRSGAIPAALPAEVRAVFAQVSPDQPLSQLESLNAIEGNALGNYDFMAALLTLFAALALLLGAIGIYGVLSYAVAQRKREMGIRMALGATAAQVARQIAGEGLALAALGVAVGLAGAFAATRLLQSFLFGVAPLDPRAFAAAALVLLALAAAAAFGPARRAARLDPLQALRES